MTEVDKAARCARYDSERPVFHLPAGTSRPLLLERINGFRDDPSVNPAHTALFSMAEHKGWAIAVSDKGVAIDSSALRQFDAVIWKNISGDVPTLS